MLKVLEKINKILKEADIDEYQIYIYKDDKHYIYQDMFVDDKDKEKDNKIGFTQEDKDEN